jgi:hypothetical protein
MRVVGESSAAPSFRAKEAVRGNRLEAFTLIELFVIVATLVILAAMLIPGFVRAKTRAERIRCTSHLKQIGLAFKTWAPVTLRLALQGSGITNRLAMP